MKSYLNAYEKQLKAYQGCDALAVTRDCIQGCQISVDLIPQTKVLRHIQFINSFGRSLTEEKYIA